MFAVCKSPTPSVAAAGTIYAQPPNLLPVIMARVPTRWTSAERVGFPTNGPKYNAFEAAILAESDQTKWNDIVEEALDQFRGIRTMTTDDVVTERAKLRAWHATYKSWASI